MQPGFQLSTNFDTIDNLNSNLLSISSLYEDHNFSILLRSKTHRKGVCELKRISDKGIVQSIPIFYDPKQSAFIIKFVLGRDHTEVSNQGREIEKRLSLSIKDNMKLGSQKQLCPSGVTKMGVITHTSFSTRGIVWSQGLSKEIRNIPNMETNSSLVFIPAFAPNITLSVCSYS